MIVALTVASYFVYVTYLSIIFIDYLHVEKITYGYLQAAITASYAFMSVFTSLIIKKIGYVTTRNLSAFITGSSSVGFIIFSVLNPNNPYIITAFMCLISLGLALFITISFGDYMEQVADNKGITSSFCTFFRLLSTSLILSATGLFFDGTIIPIAAVVFLLNISSYIIYLLINKKIKLS